MERVRESERYNGWTNYETWLVDLWMSNEEATYKYWQASARWHQDHASESSQVQEEIWTKEEAARFNLADQLKEEITDAAPSNEPTLYSDLLNAALEEVNWVEIASSWLDSLDNE